MLFQSIGYFAHSFLQHLNFVQIIAMQLHGNGSRSSFPLLVKENRVIYVLHSDKDGVLLNNISEEECSLVDWVLVDSATGGRYVYFFDAMHSLAVIK